MALGDFPVDLSGFSIDALVDIKNDLRGCHSHSQVRSQVLRSQLANWFIKDLQVRKRQGRQLEQQ